MFAREDQNFDRTAADPVLRRAAIAQLSTWRKLQFWVMIGLWAVPGLTELSSPGWSKTTVLWILAMGATAYRYLKLESELRLLRAIDHLEKKCQGEPFPLPEIRPIQRPQRQNSPPATLRPQPQLPPLHLPPAKILPLKRPAPNN